jgi:ATP-dependent Clp protease ATP-binding subunit ClpC
VLDEGHITDSKGRKVSFKNTILIMTSNAGAQRIVDPKNLGFATEKSEKKDYEKMKSAVMEEVKKSFKPEFINRIDDILVFHQLTDENMKAIADLLLHELAKRSENQMGITLKFTAGLKEHIVKKFADKKMGARPLRRGIQSEVEDAFAEEILSKRIKPGDKVTVGAKEGKVTFTVKNK